MRDWQYASYQCPELDPESQANNPGKWRRCEPDPDDAYDSWVDERMTNSTAEGAQ